MHGSRIIIILLIALLTGFPLYADGSENQKGIPGEEGKSIAPSGRETGCLPGIISIFPGVIIHGAGHYAAGDTETAAHLAAIEAAGLLVFLGASGFYIYSGASRKTSPTMVPLITTGASVFTLSWIADIYGSRPGALRRDAGPLPPPGKMLEPFFGITTVDDRQFAYSSFYTYGATFRYGGFHLQPTAWDSTDTDNHRYRVEAGYRLVGRSGPFFREQGRFLETGPLFRWGYHRFGEEGFRKTWIDSCITVRFMTGEIWKSMKDSFVFFEWGYNREWVAFTVDEKAPLLISDQFLFTSGFGIKLGRGDSSGGNITLFYNHRRDGFTGGLLAGAMGYTGISLKLIFTDVGMMVEYLYGSAQVVSLKVSPRL